MTKLSFTALERFDPSTRKGWTQYLKFSRLTHLIEVVSLDSSLCPCLLNEYTEEDWEHIADGTNQFGFFDDVVWAKQRFEITNQAQLLCVEREPTCEVATAHVGSDFVFIGYDLLDEETWISALTNCGGFDLAFSGDELSVQGLLPSFDRARAVQDALLRHYPQESHADTSIYAVWRHEPRACLECPSFPSRVLIDRDALNLILE